MFKNKINILVDIDLTITNAILLRDGCKMTQHLVHQVKNSSTMSIMSF